MKIRTRRIQHDRLCLACGLLIIGACGGDDPRHDEAKRGAIRPELRQVQPLKPSGTTVSLPGAMQGTPAVTAVGGVTPLRPVLGAPLRELQRRFRSALRRGVVHSGVVRSLATSKSTPVIVRLAVKDYQLDALLGAKKRRLQRDAIASLQQQQLSLIGASGRAARTYRTLPLIALDADAAALEKLTNSPGVVYVEPDRLHAPSLADTLPLVRADVARRATGSTGEGWAVAIIDTGVDTAHPFFAGRIVAEACYSTTMPFTSQRNLCPGGSDSTAPGSGRACPASVNGCDHGTHVAGIALGEDEDVGGIAPGANIISIQVFSRTNDDDWCRAAGSSAPCVVARSSDICAGLERVYELSRQHQIAAVNLSLGSKFYTDQRECDEDNEGTKEAIDNLISRGIAVVAAAANGAMNGGFFTPGIARPACISGVVSVGATNNADAPAGFSQKAPFLSLYAPGVSVESAEPGGGTQSMSGTSMAAPHVAGAFALLRQLYPRHHLDSLKRAVLTSNTLVTDTRGGAAWTITKPRLDLEAALSSISLAPLAPSNLRGQVVGGTRIDLSWEDNSSREAYFEIHAREAGGIKVPMPNAPDNPSDSADFSAIRLSPATGYRFKVRACDARDRCSDYTDELRIATADTRPHQPLDFRAGRVTATSIALHWDEPASGPSPTRYALSYFGGSRSLRTIPDIPAGEGSYSFGLQGLRQNTSYTFSLRACGIGCSNDVSLVVTTPRRAPVPAPPTNLRIIANAGRDVTLAWTPGNGAEVGWYELRWGAATLRAPAGGGRSIPGGDTAPINWSEPIPLAADATEHTQTLPIGGALYYLELSACSIGGCSLHSNRVSHTPVN